MASEAFIIACQNEDYDTLNALPEGTDMNPGMAVAGMIGSVKLLDYLVSKHATDYRGLMCGAAREQKLEILKLAIDRGHRNFEDVIPFAINPFNRQTCEMLLDNGAPVTPELAYEWVVNGDLHDLHAIMAYAKKKQPYAALLNAVCTKGNTEMFYVVFNSWAWDNSRSSDKLTEKELNEAMVRAVMGGNQEIVTALLAYGAKDVNSGLQMAAATGSATFTEFFIAAKADKLDDALAQACQRERKDVTKILIAKGAKSCSHCQKPLITHA